MWCVAELNAEYIERMEDVLAVYEKPYNPAEPVVCLDEKPVSLHADVRAPIPVKPGKPAKQDNEYKRCGTANVFGVVEPKAGRHFTTATPDRSGAEFARMVGHVVEQYPAARTIHLVTGERVALFASPSILLYRLGDVLILLSRARERAEEPNHAVRDLGSMRFSGPHRSTPVRELALFAPIHVRSCLLP